MSMTYEAIEQAARQLSIKEKAHLAHMLLKDLDEGDEVEAVWVAEAERRLEAYLRGDLETIDGDEAMFRLRESLR